MHSSKGNFEKIVIVIGFATSILGLQSLFFFLHTSSQQPFELASVNYAGRVYLESHSPTSASVKKIPYFPSEHVQVANGLVANRCRW